MRRALSGVALALLLAACAPRAGRIVVCARPSSELTVLGEIIAQQLQRRTGLRVERRFGLEGTLACHRALVSGKVDVYPEYTAKALVAILGHHGVRDLSAALMLVAREYPERFHAAWLPPFGLDNRAAPVAREAVLLSHPDVRAALTELAGVIADSTMRRMTALVDVQHRDPAEVAGAFLDGLGTRGVPRHR